MQKYKLNPTTQIDTHEGKTIIFDWGQGKFYALDPLSARLFNSAIQGNMDETLNALKREYDVPTQQIKKDRDNLITDLLKKRIIFKNNQNSKEFSLPSPKRIYFLLILSRLCFKFLGLLPTIKLWRCFHSPMNRDLPIEERKALTESLSTLVREECSKIFLFNIDCKERALVAWQCLRTMGLPAELVLSLQYYPFAMHAWVESFRFVVADDPVRCSYWEPIRRFD